MNEEQLEQINEEQKQIEGKLEEQEEKKEKIELVEIALFGLSLGFIIAMISFYFLNRY